MEEKIKELVELLEREIKYYTSQIFIKEKEMNDAHSMNTIVNSSLQARECQGMVYAYKLVADKLKAILESEK